LKKILVGVTEEHNNKLEEIKEKEGYDKSDTVRRALDMYFKKKK